MIIINEIIIIFFIIFVSEPEGADHDDQRLGGPRQYNTKLID